MKKQLVSPLLSGFVMPGLGQLCNRQPGKGAIMVMTASLLFIVGLFMASYKVTKAMSAVGEQTGEIEKWSALREQLLLQGTTWLWLIGGVFFLLWFWAVIDAFRWGKIRDQEKKAQEA